MKWLAWTVGLTTLGRMMMPAPPPPAPPVPGTALFAGDETPAGDPVYRLTLDEAIRLAVQNSLDIQGVVVETAKSDWDLHGARGIYDTNLNASISMNENEKAQTSALAPSRSESQNYSVGMSQLVATGAMFSANLSNTRSDLPGFAFVTASPTYDSTLSLDFDQPLLRNFGREQTRLRITLAERGRTITQEQQRASLMDSLASVETTYWRLLAAQEDLAVRRKSLALAEDFHRQEKARIEVGVLAPIALAQADATVAERKQSIIQSEADVEDLMDQLRLLLNLPAEHPLNNRPIVPVTDPGAVKPDYDADYLYRQAQEHKPELLQAAVALQNRESLVRSARNEKRPSLNLNLGLSYQGAAADDDSIPVDSSFSDSLDQVWDRDNRSWSAALVFGMPLRNRALEAQYEKAVLDRTGQEIANRKLDETVKTSIRAAVRALETAYRQIEASEVSVTLQERNLFAEQKKYENGLSTSFDVLTAQERLEAAETARLSARVSYRIALMNLKKTVGLLLDEHDVVIDGETHVPAQSTGMPAVEPGAKEESHE